MTTQPVPHYVGVDLAKRELVAHLPSQKAPTTPFPQTAAGHTACLAALPPGAHVICEATGGYQDAFVAALHAAQVPVSVVPPARVRHLARARGLLAKTDRIDAQVLTAFGTACHPRAHVALTPARQNLQALLRARQALLEGQGVERNHREHLGTQPLLVAQAEARDRLLAAQLTAVEAALRAQLAADATLAQAAQRLSAVAGVGEVTVWTALAELPELGTLAPGQTAALVGVAPYPDDSGPRQGPRQVRGGRPQVRRVFYMAAISAAHHNPILRVFYLRLRGTGKPAKVALVAVLRKLAELLNRLLHDPQFMLAG